MPEAHHRARHHREREHARHEEVDRVLVGGVHRVDRREEHEDAERDHQRHQQALAPPQREQHLDAGLARSLRPDGRRPHDRPSPVSRRNTSSSERRPARSSLRSAPWSGEPGGDRGDQLGGGGGVDHVVTRAQLAHRAGREAQVRGEAVDRQTGDRREGGLRRGARWVVRPFGVSHATSRPWSMIATRSQRCSASSMPWVVSTTVVAAVAQLADHRPRGRARRAGPCPAVGSSRKTSFGLPTSASASDSRCCWPPDMRRTSVWRESSSPTSRSSRSGSSGSS